MAQEKTWTGFQTKSRSEGKHRLDFPWKVDRGIIMTRFHPESRLGRKPGLDSRQKVDQGKTRAGFTPESSSGENPDRISLRNHGYFLGGPRFSSILMVELIKTIISIINLLSLLLVPGTADLQHWPSCLDLWSDWAFNTLMGRRENHLNFITEHNRLSLRNTSTHKAQHSYLK